jgi:hypothetical protein
MTDEELERRRKRYKLALVHWGESDSWGKAYYAIEYKEVLEQWTEGPDYTMVCDHQPHHVLRGMLKLLEEPNKC